MKHLFTILLLACCVIGNAIAEDIDNGTFMYSVNKDGTITIRSYSGDRNVNEVIVPKTIDDKEVSSINKVLGSTSSTVKAVFLPNNVQLKGQANANQNQMSLECGVLDENVSIMNDFFPFYYDNYHSTSTALKCIYTFGDANFTAVDLCGNASYLSDRGIITITYNNSNVSETVHFFNWLYNSTNPVFDKYRFEYLIWALEQHLIYKNHTIEDIRNIDLSHISATVELGTYNPAVLLSNNTTVIIDENTVYNPSIPDLTDYKQPSFDLTTTIHYSRSNTKDWNSVCLPFDLNESDFPAESNTKIYTISGADDQSIKLTRTESIDAGTPCFIHSDAESWNLTLQNREIKSTTQAGTIDIGGWKMFGSFTREIIGADKYKLNEDGKSISPTANDDAHVSPFRCYLKCTSASGAPERFAVSIDGEEQSITLTKEDSDTTDRIYFDLMGHPVQNNDEPRMIKGRNIIIR